MFRITIVAKMYKLFHSIIKILLLYSVYNTEKIPASRFIPSGAVERVKVT